MKSSSENENQASNRVEYDCTESMVLVDFSEFGSSPSHRGLLGFGGNQVPGRAMVSCGRSRPRLNLPVQSTYTASRPG